MSHYEEHFLLKPPHFKNRGSAIAIVVGLAVVITVLYFAMQSFVSNRSLLVIRMAEGLSQEEAAIEALESVYSRFKNRRPSASKSSYQTSEWIGESEVFVFVEERQSEKKRWLMVPAAGEYTLLDSVHYLSLSCESGLCWVAVAEEVFAPEPLWASDLYDAFEVGFPTQAQSPVRGFSHITSLDPREWKSLADCEDLMDRNCRLQLMQALRAGNQKIRQGEFSQGPLMRRIRSNFPYLPERMEETQIQKIFESLDSQNQKDNPALYFAVATLGRIEEFGDTVDWFREAASIRSPKNAVYDPENLAQLFQLFVPGKNFRVRSQENFQEVYYHEQRSVLSHFITREKMDLLVYQNPEKLSDNFYLNRGLKIEGIHIEVECAREFSQNLLQGLLSIQSGDESLRHPNCTSGPTLKAKSVLEGLEIQESPMLYLGERPWISLASFYLLMLKLGGATGGSFPSDVDREEVSSKVFSELGHVQSGILLLPSY